MHSDRVTAYVDRLLEQIQDLYPGAWVSMSASVQDLETIVQFGMLDRAERAYEDFVPANDSIVPEHREVDREGP